MGDAQKRFYEKIKANNLCRRCGKPLDREGSYCNACREVRNQRTANDKAFLRSMGICPGCGKERLYGDEKYCPECRAKDAARKNEDYHKRAKILRVRQQGYAKKTYTERIKNGLCPKCGKRKPDDGHKMCGICLQKAREYKRNKRINKIPDRKAEGICYRCGNPIEDKRYKLCNKCVEQNRKNSKSVSRENHYWRNLDRLIYERKKVQ